MNVNDWLERLHCPKKRPFEKLGTIGLAILCRPGATEADEVRHVGIIYRTQRYGAGLIQLLHVPDHKAPVRGRRLGNDYGWLEISLPLPRARVLVAQCVRIMERYEHRGLPYGFKYACAQFDSKGEYKANGDKGLTCATFVLAVFESAGLELLRRNEWILRTGDKSDRQRMVCHIREAGDEERAVMLESDEEIDAPRIRPQEVAAAGTADVAELPLGFRDAASRGKAIEDELLRRALG